MNLEPFKLPHTTATYPATTFQGCLDYINLQKKQFSALVPITFTNPFQSATLNLGCWNQLNIASSTINLILHYFPYSKPEKSVSQIFSNSSSKETGKLVLTKYNDQTKHCVTQKCSFVLSKTIKKYQLSNTSSFTFQQTIIFHIYQKIKFKIIFYIYH